AALPFSDGTFDAVVCQFGVMFFPQKDASYREVCRVLTPGGHYLFSVWDSHRHNPFCRIAHEIAGHFFPNDPPQFYNVPFSYYQIDARFTDINIAVVRLEKQIPDAARFARGLVHGNPLIDQIKVRGGVDPDRIVDAIAEALNQEFGSNQGRMPLQAVVFSATKRETYLGRSCPLWVKSGHCAVSGRCPLYPQKRTLAVEITMSALCQKQTLAWLLDMRA